ncbi:MAG TPA: hypothetical protein VFU46_02735 [Gemmatimonadales bacterium]|nr:hypothetical protein [Gemmatimonadales bacterium]
MPSYPKGNPLTESAQFTGRDGVGWLVYIEGVPPEAPRRRWGQTLLPGRRLRFDSADESRASTHMPAGSPFLSDARLQDLLDRAEAIPSPAGSVRSAGAPALRPRLIDSARRAARFAQVAVADSFRRWRLGADRRRALRYRSRRLVSAAADRLLTWVAAILSGRPRLRP